MDSFKRSIWISILALLLNTACAGDFSAEQTDMPSVANSEVAVAISDRPSAVVAAASYQNRMAEINLQRQEMWSKSWNGWEIMFDGRGLPARAKEQPFAWDNPVDDDVNSLAPLTPGNIWYNRYRTVGERVLHTSFMPNYNGNIPEPGYFTVNRTRTAADNCNDELARRREIAKDANGNLIYINGQPKYIYPVVLDDNGKPVHVICGDNHKGGVISKRDQFLKKSAGFTMEFRVKIHPDSGGATANTIPDTMIKPYARDPDGKPYSFNAYYAMEDGTAIGLFLSSGWAGAGGYAEDRAAFDPNTPGTPRVGFSLPTANKRKVPSMNDFNTFRMVQQPGSNDFAVYLNGSPTPFLRGKGSTDRPISTAWRLLEPMIIIGGEKGQSRVHFTLDYVAYRRGAFPPGKPLSAVSKRAPPPLPKPFPGGVSSGFTTGAHFSVKTKLELPTRVDNAMRANPTQYFADPVLRRGAFYWNLFGPLRIMKMQEIESHFDDLEISDKKVQRQGCSGWNRTSTDGENVYSDRSQGDGTMPYFYQRRKGAYLYYEGDGQCVIPENTGILARGDATIEARVNVLEGDRVLSIQLQDHLGTSNLLLSKGKVELVMGLKRIAHQAVPITPGWHTFRLVRPKNSLFSYLYIDNDPVPAIFDQHSDASVTVLKEAMLMFGRITTDVDKVGKALVDYIRWAPTAYAPALK